MKKEKTTKQNIKSYNLDKNYLIVHKEGVTESHFGTDHTSEVIENGFGMYSSQNVRSRIGPLRSQFYRIGFCRQGSLRVDFGLETFIHSRNTIHFNFPGQMFSLDGVSDDMQSFYILFTESFIEPLIPPPALQSQYPFLDYGGVPFFKLSEEEASRIEDLFFEVDKEIKAGHTDQAQSIRNLISLILIHARRSYNRQELSGDYPVSTPASLPVRFKKLVAQHFIKLRSVSGYAGKLGVSPRYLSRVIKEETARTPSDFIDDMVMMEIKALLRHTGASIAEIAYQLDFSDPSHLNHFFKNHQGVTPAVYRSDSG